MQTAADVAHSRSDRKVARAIARLEQTLERQAALASFISTLTGFLMADKDTVFAQIADLKAAIQADQASDQTVVDTLESANAALQKKIDDLIAAGNTSEAADLQEILDQIADAKSAIQPVTTGTPPGETPVG